MVLNLHRFCSQPEYTLGMLYVDSKPFCFALEDAYQPVKIAGETRIPEGEYKLSMRVEGGLAKKYGEKYPWHIHGMIWLQDVPGFEFVYFHPGNNASHTAGCLLVGEWAGYHGELSNSVAAYRRLYERVVPEIERGSCLLVVR